MVIPLAGILVYVSFYLAHRCVRYIQHRRLVAAAGGADLSDVTTQRDLFDTYENTLIHGMTNWLDLCYAGVTFRCFQVFYRQFYGAAVMAAAPAIAWDSPTHAALLGLSVAITIVYVAGVPLCYSAVLWWGKKTNRLNDHTYKTRWGWMVNRYEYEFFW